ncbi:methylthioribulose 1-phosphate dehydratase [Acidiphilium sp. PA]|uniref:methylthioribulose 1-phosphate dehydratase n=1 Tax=Acidiphilium sp. PA TaxID=2871705 RepID=UPI0022448129|nr:methylthioribulose 1-phosphate dehydratase [Acidiphilium sp. PA]MCW8305524.1 methylthioribulose 1-phosphate dehydratase [Acidiphilium sp. PA]
MHKSLLQAAHGLIAIGARMDARGWVPASSGNLSARLDDQRMAITRSGVHKGRLTEADIIEVDFDGVPRRTADKPSAETLLHCQLYRHFPAVGAVLHGHSVAATALSMVTHEESLILQDYEILKAFPGITTHQTVASVPVFDNDQDIARLADVIAPSLEAAPIGYILRGHGVYAWGPDIERCFWRLEALEFLISCECERRLMR